MHRISRLPSIRRKKKNRRRNSAPAQIPEERQSDNRSQTNRRGTVASMGNAPSSLDSCSSGIESTRMGALTMVSVSSMETLNIADNAKLVGDEPDPAFEQSAASSGSDRSKRSRKGPVFFGRISHAFQAAGHALGHRVNRVEHFMFPRTPHYGGGPHHRPSSRMVAPKVRGGVLLRGCITDDEHKRYVRTINDKLRPLKSTEGLKAAGFEFRVVPIGFTNSDSADEGDGFPATIPEDGPAIMDDEGSPFFSPGNIEQAEDENDVPEMADEDAPNVSQDNEEKILPAATAGDNDDVDEESQNMTRLFHMESNTMITGKNRKYFIADGDMYDNIARLCQEYAQEIMIREGHMEWVMVCEAGNNPEPIRALVSEALSEDDSLLDQKPTLLIATGKGKVRAGIFSRQHIMISGLECSTALPIVRQAKKRQMNVVMVDPNVHGERLGMITFEKSMARLFRRWEVEAPSNEGTCPADQPPLAQRDLFVLSHSQSGAQLARYLLDKSEHYVPHIRAVAFTDATHNIQWAKEKEDLHQLLQSEKCVYFRCAKQKSENALEPLATVGKEVETDSFWEHRFGRINTRCAGTSEHSLTNWFVRSHIWDHFDNFMTRLSPTRHPKIETADKELLEN